MDADWKPIESAPPNTNLLLFCPWRDPTNIERVELGMASHGRVGRHGDRISGTWSHHAWATHWDYLPINAPTN